MPKKTNTDALHNPEFFARAVAQAKETYIPWLTGDGRYLQPETNFTALQAMIIARAPQQEWFWYWLKHEVGQRLEDLDTYLLLSDWALQVATDASQGYDQFFFRPNQPR